MDAKKILAFAIGPIGGAAVGFVTLPVMAWLYSAESIGRIAMLQVASSFCVLLFGLGLDQAYVREYHESSKKPALLKASLLPGLVLLIILLSGSFVFPTFISSILFDAKSVQFSMLVAVCMLVAFISRFLSLILRMEERGLAFSASQILPKILLLFIILIYYFSSENFDFFHLLLAYTISLSAVTLIYGWNTRIVWKIALGQDLDIPLVKSLLRFGAPLVVGSAAFWGLTAIDRLFLRSLSNFDELGIYSVATNFAAVAVIFQSIFSTVWAPIVYRWAAEGINSEKVDRVTEYVLVGVICFFSIAGLFSWISSYLLPEKYRDVQYILMACMGYPLFYTLSETTVVGLGISRKTHYSMACSLVAVIVNLCANYFLIPILGAAGAAISAAISFWVLLVTRTEFSCRVWRPLPRIKIYFFTFLCLLISIGCALFGEKNKVIELWAWFTLLLISGFVFRSTFISGAKAIVEIVRHPSRS